MMALLIHLLLMLSVILLSSLWLLQLLFKLVWCLLFCVRFISMGWPDIINFLPFLAIKKILLPTKKYFSMHLLQNCHLFLRFAFTDYINEKKSSADLWALRGAAESILPSIFKVQSKWTPALCEMVRYDSKIKMISLSVRQMLNHFVKCFTVRRILCQSHKQEVDIEWMEQ